MENDLFVTKDNGVFFSVWPHGDRLVFDMDQNIADGASVELEEGKVRELVHHLAFWLSDREAARIPVAGA